MTGTTRIDLAVSLVDYRDRTITVAYHLRGTVADADRIGARYMSGWNERGTAMFGADFRSHADGYRVHDDTGRILAYG